VVVYLSHSDCGRHDTGWGHPEHVGRLRAIARALRSDLELAATLDQREGRHATREELSLVHDPGYVAHISGVAQPGELVRVEADTVVSEGSWDAATAAAG
jgi:acetoin utilization deacetylase AcuC-like enzyme